MRSSIGFVADIGGTNARFAMINPESLALSLPTTYPSRNFASLPSAVAAYVSTLPTRPRIGCIAVAGPIVHQAVRVTNLGWSSTLDELRSASGVERLVLVNDFEALALSLPHLGETDLLPIGMALGELGGARAVLGPGTGLGRSQGSFRPPPAGGLCRAKVAIYRSLHGMPTSLQFCGGFARRESTYPSNASSRGPDSFASIAR